MFKIVYSFMIIIILRLSFCEQLLEEGNWLLSILLILMMIFETGIVKNAANLDLFNNNDNLVFINSSFTQFLSIFYLFIVWCLW